MIVEGDQWGYLALNDFMPPKRRRNVNLKKSAKLNNQLITNVTHAFHRHMNIDNNRRGKRAKT